MDQNTRKELTTLKLREKAAKFAKEAVNIQMKSFKVIKPFFLVFEVLNTANVAHCCPQFIRFFIF